MADITSPIIEGAHPLLYASLTPLDPSNNTPHIALYKPKTEYSVGRNPRSDVVFDSQRLDWSVCTLQWDGRSEIRVVDLNSSNGIWINRRRLAAGSSRVLQDGDTVFFSLCSLQTPKDGENPPPLKYRFSAGYEYTYNQYTDRLPPLSPTDQSVRTRLDALETSSRRVDDELEKLRQEKEAILQEQHTIMDGLPDPPPFVRSNLTQKLQQTWDSWDKIRKQECSTILPEDFRELCRPDTEVLAYDSWWREEYQTLKYEVPSPLPWGHCVGGWVDENHRSGWPDWNNPDLIWGGRMTLDQSRPLTIPPSIIYWSIEHKLPVYAHPHFDQDSTRIYARPYAQCSYGFSDYSAALHRQELDLGPLENPPIVRPCGVMDKLDCGWCPDEDELAVQVAAMLPTLRPDDESIPPLRPEDRKRPKNVRELVENLKGVPSLFSDLKRKRAESGAFDVDKDDYLPSPPSRHSPLAGGEAPSGVSVSNPKRRRTSVSSSPSPRAGVEDASSSTGGEVSKDSPVPVAVTAPTKDDA